MLQNSSSSISSLNPQQEAAMDDEQRQKREIAKRREEDRKRREVKIIKNKFIHFKFFSFSVKHLINHYHLIVILMLIFHL
jgi:hypothetical protein